MLATILTPTLNAERHLAGCLESLTRQTHGRERIQHVVIDGGSTDRTVELARAAGAEVQAGADRSLYEALNRGLELARGEVVGWLNADDAYAPDAVARVVAALQAHPEAEIAVGDLAIEGLDGRRVVRARADALQRIREGRRRGTWVTPLAVFYRTRTLRALGDWLPQYRVASDLDLWMRAAARDPLPKVVHAGSVLGTFRIHEASLSAGASPVRSLEETIEIARRWHEDPSRPAGVRRFALYLLRRYSYMQRIWRIREASRARKVAEAIACWRELRRLGPGAMKDMVTTFS